MKADNAEPTEAQAANVIPITIAPKPRPGRQPARFAILEFTNRTGSQSWRVSGYKRDGTRIRENFAELPRAQARQLELEGEYLKQERDTALRATKLTADQLQLAEVAIIKLSDDWPRLLDAVGYWLEHGRHNTVPESARLDEAVPVDLYLF